MRATAAALLLLWCAPGARAGDAPPLDLTGAAVLASPGLPEALLPFLPSAPRPLRWPLPEGPVLVLGLPERDALAREVGETLGVLAPDEDLAGGYVVSAWADGRRPLAVVLASDAAALLAARFELACEAPEGQGDRTEEVTGAAGGARTAVAPGRRAVRPAWRERALVAMAPSRGGSGDDPVLRAAGARANRLWLPAHPTQAGRTGPLARRAAAFGVEPVLAAVVAPMGMDPADELADAQARTGARRFALAFGEPRDAPAVARIVRTVAERLRPHGLDQLLVRPPPGAAPGPWPDVPEAEAVWTGPSPVPMEVSLAAAEAAARASATPLHFVETWASVEEGLTDAGAPPSAPRGRDARLGEALQGIVVPDGPLAEAVLGRAFEPGTEEPGDATDALLPHVPFGRLPATEVLRGTARSLRAEAVRAGAVAPWMARYAATLERRADALPPEEAVLGVPLVPERIAPDGRLDERAWAYAASRTLAGVTLLAVSDGRALRLALRVPRDDPAFEVRLALGDAVPDLATLRLTDDAAVRTIALAALEGPEDHLRVGRADRDGETVFEVEVDRVALAGDAFPTRVLHFAWEVRRAGTAAAFGPGTPAALVVGR